MADVKILEINGTEFNIKDEKARQDIEKANTQLSTIANEDLVIGEDGKLYIKQGDGTKKGIGVEIPTGTAEVPSNIVLYEEIEDEEQETLIPIKAPNGTTYYIAVDNEGALTVQNTSGDTVWEGGGSSIEGVYFISNKLTQITTNNNAKNVLEGDSYIATLTPTSGYEISSITVKMGNVDITSTVYSNGNINITNVTGNIVITAVATKIPVKYTVTNTLNNATNNNSATQVNENTSYIAKITANTGYELNSVTVTMGGTDITSSCYSNGNINIASVTGDIVITATTSKVAITKTVEISSVASAIEDGKNAQGSSVSDHTRYTINNVKQGDIITTAANNSANNLFYADSTNLTSNATKVNKDNYSWYQFTFTADKDYNVFYVSARSDYIAEGRCTWTYTIEGMENYPSYNNEFIPTISDTEINDLKVFSNLGLISHLGYDITGNKAKKELEGKTWIAMGDSYTKGMETMLSTLAEKYGLTIDNRGIVSSTITGDTTGNKGFQPMWNRTKSVCNEYETNGNTDNVALITFMGGANDGFGKDTWIGTGINDTDTYHIYGAMHTILNEFRKTFKNAKIIVILQPSSYNRQVSSVTSDETAQIYGFTDLAELQLLDDYQYSNYAMFLKEKAVQDVAEFYNCSIVDCCFNWHSVLNKNDRAKYWQSDKLHLTNLGYQEVTDAIENKMIEIFG